MDNMAMKQPAFQLLPLTTEVFQLDLALQHACHNSRQADQSISAYPHPNPGSCIFLMSKDKIQQHKVCYKENSIYKNNFWQHIHYPG